MVLFFQTKIIPYSKTLPCSLFTSKGGKVINIMQKKYLYKIYMFESKNLYYYIFAFSVIAISGYFAKKFKSNFEDSHDEYELIKKYLLNDSPLYGYNKPKIWIHTKYETNARKWKSFYSRTSNDLNEPYIHLTIKTIINHCSNDFNVCLIDDDTFS